MGQFWCMTLQMKTHFRRCVALLLWSRSVGRVGYSTWNIVSEITHWFLHLSKFYDKDYFHLYSTLCPFVSSSTLSLFSFLCLPPLGLHSGYVFISSYSVIRGMLLLSTPTKRIPFYPTLYHFFM
jgi:hypothetical protein